MRPLARVVTLLLALAPCRAWTSGPFGRQGMRRSGASIAAMRGGGGGTRSRVISPQMAVLPAESEERAATRASSRLSPAFGSAREAGTAALVSFVTAGYPHPRDTVALLLALQEGGSDVIELGVPFTDPQADGATIQASSMVALSHGTTLDDTLGFVKTAREQGLTIPVVLMGCVS